MKEPAIFITYEAESARDFSLEHVQTASWAHPVSVKGYQVSFSRVKLPVRGVDHLPSSNAEVKNNWSYTSTPSICLHVVRGGKVNFAFIKLGGERNSFKQSVT